MILSIFVHFMTAIRVATVVAGFGFKLIECLVLAGIAAYLAMHVAHHILEQAEEQIARWTGDARNTLHIVYGSSSLCVGFLIVGGLSFDGWTICFRVVAAVVALCLARMYLRTI